MQGAPEGANGSVQRCTLERPTKQRSQLWTYRLLKLVGVDSGGETPDPISNSAVKPASGDGNAGATLCESSTMPALFLSLIFGSGFFFIPSEIRI